MCVQVCAGVCVCVELHVYVRACVRRTVYTCLCVCVQLPATGQASYNPRDYPVRWIRNARPGHSYGWVKLAHVGGTTVGEDADRFLLGYAEYDETQSNSQGRGRGRGCIERGCMGV